MSTAQEITPDLPEVPEVDQNQVDAIMEQAWMNVGCSIRIQGVLQADRTRAKELVFNTVVDNHELHSEAEIETAKAFSKPEFYGEVFGDKGDGRPAPGPALTTKDINELAAVAGLAHEMWDWCTGSTTGYVQNGLEDSGLVLCQHTIQRPLYNPLVGRVQPMPALVRWVTADHDMILKYYTGPAGEAYVKAAKRYQAKLRMVVRRQKEIQPKLTAQAAKFLGQAKDELPLAVPSRATQAAIDAGNGQ